MVGAEKHILNLLQTPTDLWGRYSLEASRFFSGLLGAFNACLLQRDVVLSIDFEFSRAD